jgi:hypothetical protein
VFDQNLSQSGWNHPTRVDRLAAFLRGIGGRRLDIIVHDTAYLETACPRMLNLLRTHSSKVTIYRTGAEAKLASDPLLIVDDRHYLHRSLRAAARDDGHRAARAGAAARQPLRRDLGDRRAGDQRHCPWTLTVA